MRTIVRLSAISLFLLLLCFALLFLSASKHVSAHPGNTSSDGAHYCWTNCEYWGYDYGTRHSHYDDIIIEDTGPSEAEQGRTNGAAHANSVNRSYIEDKAKAEGSLEGSMDGAKETSLYANQPDTNTTCNEEVKYDSIPTAAYKAAFQDSYSKTCVPIYNAAYYAAYTPQYDVAKGTREKAASEKVAVADNTKNSSTAGDIFSVIFFGGMAALFFGGAMWESYGQSLKDWWNS